MSFWYIANEIGSPDFGAGCRFKVATIRAVKAAKAKGATDCSVAPRLVPSPRYFAKFKLLQLWPCRTGAGRIALISRGLQPLYDEVAWITPSSLEQKPRTPLWLKPAGAPLTV